MSEFVKDQAHRERIEKGEEVPRVSPGSESALPPVQRIEMVSGIFSEEVAPMWRVMIDKYCIDFETETAANNVRNAILGLVSLAQAAPDRGVQEALAQRLRDAAMTAQNDDLSKPKSEKRERHIIRIETILDAAEYLKETAVTPSPGAGERNDVQDWITYADRLEKVLEVVAGSSTDALKRSQAQEGLRLVRPSPASSTNRGAGK